MGRRLRASPLLNRFANNREIRSGIGQLRQVLTNERRVIDYDDATAAASAESSLPFFDLVLSKQERRASQRFDLCSTTLRDQL
jgi:hypothetical protein